MKALEQWLGFVIWILVTVAVSIVGVFLVPLVTSGGTHIPISLLIVVVANLLLPSVFVRGLDLSWAWFVAPLMWAIVVIPAATVTSDDDILLPGSTYSSTLNLIYLGLGAVAAVIGSIVSRMDIDLLRRAGRKSRPHK